MKAARTIAGSVLGDNLIKNSIACRWDFGRKLFSPPVLESWNPKQTTHSSGAVNLNLHAPPRNTDVCCSVLSVFSEWLNGAMFVGRIGMKINSRFFKSLFFYWVVCWSDKRMWKLCELVKLKSVGGISSVHRFGALSSVAFSKGQQVNLNWVRSLGPRSAIQLNELQLLHWLKKLIKSHK